MTASISRVHRRTLFASKPDHCIGNKVPQLKIWSSRFVLYFALLAPPLAAADSSCPELASYYDRHMAIIEGIAWGWTDSSSQTLIQTTAVQVGVGRDAFYTLLANGELTMSVDSSEQAMTLMHGITQFAAGDSGVLAIDSNRALWHVRNTGRPKRIAENVSAASVGDGADYYVTTSGELFARGKGHRGQFGDGHIRLIPTSQFIQVASDVRDIKAHTGHALYLSRRGEVMGTGGNLYGPLSRHGLGDKATRWGRLFSDAKAIATGASHSAAIRNDDSLWLWGRGFSIEPVRMLGQAACVAAGSNMTIVLMNDGGLWQWRPGETPQRILPLQ